MRRFTFLALAVAIATGAAFSPFASGAPDGLERVARTHGFADRERPAAVREHAPANDYLFPGVRDERLARSLAGLAGTLAVFALGGGAVALARRRALGARTA